MRISSSFLLIIIILLLSFFQVSVAKDITREIKAIGASQKEAIANALLEAVQQVKGVKISGTEDLHSQLKEVSNTLNGESTDTQNISTSQQHSVSKVTEGLIKSYSILSVEKNTNGLGWEAIINVVIPVYKTPGISPHRLRKIAVIPFRVRSISMDALNKNLEAKEVVRQFNQKIVTQLTQSRRFSVLDREYTEAFINERNFILSTDSSIEEQMKIGEALGVDYLLLGTITEFKIEDTEHYIKTLDETRYAVKAYFKADFRIMVMATRQIKWSDSVKINASSKQLKNIFNKSGSQAVIDYILENAARKIIHSSLDNIYPIKVLKIVNKNTIYLNQGGKMTALGDELGVYSQGENIADPETGLMIKIDGEQVATVKITKVQAKYSLAKLIKGSIDDMVVGAILRKQLTPTPSKTKQQRVMQPKW